MTPNETYQLLIASLSAQMQQVGYGIHVQSAYQTTQQGVIEQPFLAVSYVSSRRYGWPSVVERLNTDTNHFDRVEEYWLEEVYQIAAYAIPTPTMPNAAYVHAARAAAVLQSQQMRKTLLDHEIGFTRIDQIRMPYNENEMGRNELSPSFDFSITRKEQLVYSIPIVNDLGIDINRV